MGRWTYWLIDRWGGWADELISGWVGVWVGVRVDRWVDVSGARLRNSGYKAHGVKDWCRCCCWVYQSDCCQFPWPQVRDHKGASFQVCVFLIVLQCCAGASVEGVLHLYGRGIHWWRWQIDAQGQLRILQRQNRPRCTVSLVLCTLVLPYSIGRMASIFNHINKHMEAARKDSKVLQMEKDKVRILTPFSA